MEGKRGGRWWWLLRIDGGREGGREGEREEVDRSG